MRRLRGAYFGRGDRERRVLTAFHRACRRQSGRDGSGDFTGTAREFLLYRLELANLAAELRAFRRVAHRKLQRAFERARHGKRAHQRAAFP